MSYKNVLFGGIYFMCELILKQIIGWMAV